MFGVFWYVVWVFQSFHATLMKVTEHIHFAINKLLSMFSSIAVLFTEFAKKKKHYRI